MSFYLHKRSEICYQSSKINAHFSLHFLNFYTPVIYIVLIKIINFANKP